MTQRCDGKLWFVSSDWSGLLCVTVGWLVIAFVNYAVQAYAILPLLEKVGETWPLVVLFSLAYQCVICLIYWSHFMCMCSEPGLWPRDPTARERWRKEIRKLDKTLPSSITEGERNAELYDLRKRLRYCARCELFKPSTVHHCSTCDRCIADMDHHCPWVNNCVGGANIKFFLQFLLYVGIGTSWSIVAVTLRGFAAFYLGALPGATGRRRYRLSSVEMRQSMFTVIFCTLAFILSVFFLVFIAMMAWDQYGALTSGASGIDALQGNSGAGRRTIKQALEYACGRPFHYSWFLPTRVKRKRRSHVE